MNRFAPIGAAGLLVDVTQVIGYRVRTDIQKRRDLLVGHAFDQVLENLSFATSDVACGKCRAAVRGFRRRYPTLRPEGTLRRDTRKSTPEAKPPSAQKTGHSPLRAATVNIGLW